MTLDTFDMYAVYEQFVQGYFARNMGMLVLNPFMLSYAPNVGANARRPRRRVERLVMRRSFMRKLVHGIEISCFIYLLATLIYKDNYL